MVGEVGRRRCERESSRWDTGIKSGLGEMIPAFSGCAVRGLDLFVVCGLGGKVLLL